MDNTTKMIKEKLNSKEYDFLRTNEINKCAHLAEMAIVYGNRFRPVSSEVNRQLNYSENLYYKGEYKKSIELTANMLEKIEPGIYNRLVKKYTEN